MDKKKNLHDGHRNRMREEFLANGFDEKTPPHKVLEMLLFYCVPRKDTNDLAHLLLNKYKTLSGVLDAPVEELAEFDMLSRAGATLLKLVIPVARIYNLEKKNKVERFNNIGEVGVFLQNEYFGFTKEKLSLMGLDAAGKMLFFEFIAEGDMATVGVSIRDIVKRVLDSGAMCVVLAHNHPGGTALPSNGDATVTAEIVEVMTRMGVCVLDHIIISDGDYVSMKSSSQYKHIFSSAQIPRG